MIKYSLRIVITTLIVFISLCFDVFSMKTDDDFDIIKTKTNLAEQGDIDAQYELALMKCREGATVEELCQASFWFVEAKKNGHISAQIGLGLVLEKLDLEEKRLKEALEVKIKEGVELDNEMRAIQEDKKNIDKKYDAYYKAIDEIESEETNLLKHKQEKRNCCGCNLL